MWTVWYRTLNSGRALWCAKGLKSMPDGVFIVSGSGFTCFFFDRYRKNCMANQRASLEWWSLSQGSPLKESLPEHSVQQVEADGLHVRFYEPFWKLINRLFYSYTLKEKETHSSILDHLVTLAPWLQTFLYHFWISKVTLLLFFFFIWMSGPGS